MQGARVDKGQFWMATQAGSDVPARPTFPDAIKQIARQYGVSVTIDERAHTVDFETVGESLTHKLELALDALAGEYEV